MQNLAQTPKAAAQGRQDSQAEAVARMQRGLLRLSLAYLGQNKELDEKLKELGQLVRSGRRQGDRQSLIDQIVDRIINLDLKAPQPGSGPGSSKAGDAGSDPHASLRQFLGDIDAPDTLVPEIERAERELTQLRDAAKIQSRIRETAQALSRHLMQSPEVCSDAPALRALMEDLVDQLDIPAAMLGDVAKLRAALTAAEDVPAFVACTTRIAALVAGAREALEQQIERLTGFLTAVAKRLEGFEQYVSVSRDAGAENLDSTIQLSETVLRQIDGIRDASNKATSLDELRAQIETRLDTIGDGLEQFVDAQRDRTSRTQETLDQVTSQLRQLEQQTETLREDLEQEQARVVIDPLTSVLNRRGYEEMGEKLFARWKRYGGNLSLALLDLDLFKNINDRFGHAAGDRVLTTVANQVKSIIRDSDVLCRYGGEEFVLLLPETGADQACELIEKIRAHIETCPFRHKDTPVSVTFSAGVTGFRREDDIDTAFERADQAMYAAKRLGRNRTCTEDDITADVRRRAGA